MNYGYGEGCVGWNGGKTRELAKELNLVLADFPATQGGGPYIEIGGMYGGVRVRRITWVENQDELIARLDATYDRVMGNKVPT